MADPTVYPELNAVLDELVASARTILGDNFCGAYLQGSFAVGDADMHSDCDFLIPVYRPITVSQEGALRALHDEIPTRDGHWTKHLEGSYPHLDELASLDQAKAFYKDFYGASNGELAVVGEREHPGCEVAQVGEMIRGARAIAPLLLADDLGNPRFCGGADQLIFHNGEAAPTPLRCQLLHVRHDDRRMVHHRDLGRRPRERLRHRDGLGDLDVGSQDQAA